MEQIVLEAVVTYVKPSEVKKGVFYIRAKAKGWGDVKFATDRSHSIGDVVVVRSQKLRTMTDMIRWKEVTR